MGIQYDSCTWAFDHLEQVAGTRLTRRWCRTECNAEERLPLERDRKNPQAGITVPLHISHKLGREEALKSRHNVSGTGKASQWDMFFLSFLPIAQLPPFPLSLVGCFVMFNG